VINRTVKRDRSRKDTILQVPHGAAGPDTPPVSLTTNVHIALSVGWALLPLVTLGLASVATFAYGAIRLRSRPLGFCAAAYGLAASAFLLLIDIGPDASWQSNLGVAIGLTSAAVATGHAFAIRQRVLDGPIVTAEDKARDALRRRVHSRKLLTDNPQLAKELNIGRPDLHSDFDDGGLVDVNHVPEEYLTTLPGIDAVLASNIIEVRDSIGGFDSLDDMEVLLGLPPGRLDWARERTIFVR
jgi:DNA uptake protein ComE-like DNA-binding protein